MLLSGLVVLGRNYWNRTKLLQEDPQMLELFKHLEEDKKSGRL